MIYAAGFIVVALVSVALVSVWLDRRKHSIAMQIVQDALAKAAAEEDAEKGQLSDPERKLNQQEVSNALAHLRRLGSKPL